MTRISGRTNDGGYISAGIAIFVLIASMVLLVWGCYVSALSHYAGGERRTFLESIDGHNEIH